MNILILGASCQIGHELALLFSPQNSITLLGRNHERLQLVAMQCSGAGAKSIDLIAQDISDGVESLVEKFDSKQFDLVVNLVSAASRIKDSELLPRQLEGLLFSDLLLPVQLIDRLIEGASRPLKIIFISSVLASVQSPDRRLYGSLKLLQEICLQRLADCHHGSKLLVVKVGKVIPHERSSDEARKLAGAIFEAHLSDKNVLNYGLLGKIYLLLFYSQPLLFRFVVKLQRVLRKS